MILTFNRNLGCVQGKSHKIVSKVNKTTDAFTLFTVFVMTDTIFVLKYAKANL